MPGQSWTSWEQLQWITLNRGTTPLVINFLKNLENSILRNEHD